MAKQLKSGASVPMADRPNILIALNEVAETHKVDPAAIAAIIHTESVWNTRNVTGQYVGLTQVGSEFRTKHGFTKRQFLELSAPRQIELYGIWLDDFKFKKAMSDAGIDVLALPLARQAAVLQAEQFAPNGRRWKTALAEGDFTVRSTPSRQADVLGDTSIGDMESYYAGFFRDRPPVYQGGAGPEAVRAAKARARRTRR
jgi:hypothetical protein